MLEALTFWSIKIAGAILLLIAAAIALLLRVRQHKTVSTKSRLANDDLKSQSERRCPHFTEKEIRAAHRTYVRPDAAQVDPSNELEYRKFVSVREQIFRTVPRYLSEESKRHVLVLADSGMGKTTFCLNFFDYLKKRLKSDVALISLARTNALQRVEEVPSKRTTTLILDALDEDPKALINGADRISEIMDACSDFPLVILTCRTHFFENDAAIPVRTGVSKIVPRSAGKSPAYEFARLYLLPFDKSQIEEFLRRSFPVFNIMSASNRRKSREMISTIPDLSARPMLLALVPQLIKEKAEFTEIYELYEYMVQQWLVREEKWVSGATLLHVSTELAMHLSLLKQEIGVDRMAPHEIAELKLTTDDLKWRHLTTRSLLNRDSEGNLKFAHRSIMEFLAVRGSLNSDARATKLIWTDLMRELLLSYGGLNPRSQRASDLFDALIEAREVTRFPFADAVPPPSVRTKGEFERIAVPHQSAYIARRTLPSTWLASSVATKKREGLIFVDDKNNGLRWRFLDLSDEDIRTQAELYRVSASGAFSSEATDGYDKPSFAEFLTLLSIQAAEGHEEFIDPARFYWLGDRYDRGGQTIVSINNQLNHPAAVQLVTAVRDSNLSIRLNLYAIDQYRMSRKAGDIKALELYVQRRPIGMPELFR